MGNLIRGPFTEPESEDDAYQRWRQEMDDGAMKAAEERFEAWWNSQHGMSYEMGHFMAVKAAYLAADAEATKRTAQRCVEICNHADKSTHPADLADAIAKEFSSTPPDSKDRVLS